MNFNIEQYKIVKFSGLFDEDYYSKNYNIKTDPIVHYLHYGWKEGKNPSKYFNTNFYLSKYKDVRSSNINPLIHYILHGKNEKRSTCELPIKKENSDDYFYSAPQIPALKTDRPIDILIPVYNGLKFLKPLIESIYKNTFIPFRLLVCDDAR